MVSPMQLLTPSHQATGAEDAGLEICCPNRVIVQSLETGNHRLTFFSVFKVYFDLFKFVYMHIVRVCVCMRACVRALHVSIMCAWHTNTMKMELENGIGARAISGSDQPSEK